MMTMYPCPLIWFKQPARFLFIRPDSSCWSVICSAGVADRNNSKVIQHHVSLNDLVLHHNNLMARIPNAEEVMR